MKHKELINDLKSKKPSQLKSDLTNAIKALALARWDLSLGKAGAVNEVRRAKKTIARINTLLTQVILHHIEGDHETN